MVLSIVVFANDAEAAGLVWRAINKTGSLISDLGDVAYCTVNGAPLEYQSSNSTWICGALKQNISEENQNNGYAGLGSSGQLQIAQQNGTTEYQTNKGQSNGYASLGSSGQIQNTQQNSTLVSNSQMVMNLQTMKQLPILTASSAMVTNSSGYPDVSVTVDSTELGTLDGVTTIVQSVVPSSTSTNATLVQGTSSGTTTIKNISGLSGINIQNGTNTVILNYTRIVSLSGNVTAGDILTGGVNNQTHVLVFSIPLTASSGNLVTGMLNTVTNVTGIAPQYGINSTQATTKGTCYFSTPTGAAASLLDNINVIDTGKVVDTAETTWFSNLEIPQSVLFSCSVVTGSTAGNLQVWLKPEALASTKAQVRAVVGSFYQITP